MSALCQQRTSDTMLFQRPVRFFDLDQPSGRLRGSTIWLSHDVGTHSPLSRLGLAVGFSNWLAAGPPFATASLLGSCPDIRARNARALTTQSTIMLRYLGRLIFLLIFPRALPAQPDNKHDEAQQPQNTPSNAFCGAHAQLRFNANNKVPLELKYGGCVRERT